MSIVRDENGIIMQHDIYMPENRPDGGDSAARTGIMALCGSPEDRQVIFMFEQVGLGMRHPYQVPWNNVWNFTRDQLTCLAAGLKAAALVTPSSACQRLYKSHKDRGWRAQNREKDVVGSVKSWPDGPDWLAPDIRLHLRLCADIPSKWYLIGWAFLWLSLIYNTKIKPNAEQNQFICQVIIAGPKWVKRYKRMHKSWRENLQSYWNGWRDQKEISEAMINKLEEYK